MEAVSRTVNFSPPAGYDPGFAMPEQAQTQPSAQASVRLPRSTETTGQAPDLATSAASLLTAAKRVDYGPIGIGEVAAAIIVGLVWRHLKRAPDRIRAIAADPTQSWPPHDDHAESMAFEARYGRGARR